MKTVSRFEANLLKILHGFFGRVSQDQLLKLVESELDQPRCLSRNAVELVKDTLRKGVPMSLSRRGGWRRDRFLRSERISEGRLWDRTSPNELGLNFSRHSLWFLIWITAKLPNRSRLEPVPAVVELTMGDRLLYFLAYESLRGTEAAQGLLEQSPFQTHALLWLTYLSDMLEVEDPGAWDFSPWINGLGGCVLESLQPHLAHRWLQMERQKLRIYQPDMMNRFGQLQQKILSALFDAAESAGRKDLCRFFLIAMKQFLWELSTVASSSPKARPYNLDLSRLRMAERTEVYQSAACCLREIERMDRWNREARATGYLDEGYALSQLWKSDWEQLDGDRLCALSQARLQTLDPMNLGNPPGEGSYNNGAEEANESNST